MWRVEIEDRNRISTIYHSLDREPIDSFVKSIELLHWKCVVRVYSPDQVMVHYTDLRRSRMAVLCDWRIRKFAEQYDMINPFSESVSGNNIISFGLSAAGYDVRLGNEIKVYRPDSNMVINPKKFRDSVYQDKLFDSIILPDHDVFTIQPHGYILAHTREYFRIPRSICGECKGKSTYARCGLIINTTPLEPEWDGQLTLEISNPTQLPIDIYIAEGIAQIQFYYLSDNPECSYKDKGGKYNGQLGVTPPRN